MNTKWTTILSDDVVQSTAEALKKNNFEVTIVNSGKDAAKRVYELVPEGADVQVNTSITLETIGVLDTIDNSGKYNSHRKKIFSLDHEKDEEKIRILRSVADYALGSAHAVTEQGSFMIASYSGSQIPTVSFGAKKAIFVIGAQKIVKNIEEGFKRIQEHSLPLESKRARKAYGLPDDWNSFVSKILIYNKESTSGRVHIILVKEVLGF